MPYVEQGDPSGTPALLVHAYVDSWRSFETLLGHLPESIRALAPTLRGHGDADKPASGYGLDELTTDLVAFMDDAGVEAAVVVGSSSGGYLAQRLALDVPERVLIGVPRSLREPPAVLEEIETLEDPVDAEFVREFVTATASGAVRPDFLQAMIGESVKVPAHVWKAALHGLVDAVPPTETGTIVAPTLIVWGDQDPFLSRADQERLAAAIPGAELAVYEGTGHLVHWEEPERVASEVADFVRRLGR
jgi:non-heme chloroperoxidase